MTEIDHSLRRLGTDYVDLYQIHRTRPDDADRGDARGAARPRQGGQGRATSAPRRCAAWEFAKALHLQRAARLGAVRVDAGPLQPARPRGGARDAPALRRRGRRHDRLEPAGPRPARPRRWRRDATARSATDGGFADLLYTATADSDRAIIDAVGAVAEARGVTPGPDRARLAAQQPGRRGAAGRREHDRADRRRGRLARHRPHRRRDLRDSSSPTRRATTSRASPTTRSCSRSWPASRSSPPRRSGYVQYEWVANVSACWYSGSSWRSATTARTASSRCWRHAGPRNESQCCAISVTI